jgi:hypothetical protein
MKKLSDLETHLLDIVIKIVKIPGIETVSSNYTADSIVLIFRYEDGKNYELVLKESVK